MIYFKLIRRVFLKFISLARGIGPLTVLALSLSSCVSLISDSLIADADMVYRLSRSVEPVKVDENAVVIRIDTPLTSRDLRTNDIMVALDNRQMSRLSGARWAETIPILVQRALVDRLAANSGLVGILPLSGAQADYWVNIDIRNFEAKFDQGKSQAPLAIVDYRVSILKASNRKLFATYDVRISQRADAARVSSIVIAQDMANQEALNAITLWLDEQF